MDKTFIDKETKAGQTSDVRSADTDLRSEFEKDYHRIIGSASFGDFRTRHRYFH